jgi:hypothetical protein
MGLGIGIGSNRIAHGNKTPVALRITWASGFEDGEVAEDTATTTTLGTLAATDPDGDSITFAIHSDADSKFSLTGASLKLANALDYETTTSHEVTIRASDPSGAYVERVFTVTVTDVAEGGADRLTLGADLLKLGTDQLVLGA